MREFNHMAQVTAAIDAAKPKALLEAALIVEASAKTLSPIKTGNLKGSITHGLLGTDDAWIGTNVEYGPYQEYGTRKMAAQPYLRPAVDANRLLIQQRLSAQIAAAIKAVVR